MIEGHRVSNQARRGYFETNGGANVGNRPIIGLANVSPTNGIVPCRSRRTRLGTHHFKRDTGCPNRAGAYDLTIALSSLHEELRISTLQAAISYSLASPIGEKGPGKNFRGKILVTH